MLRYSHVECCGSYRHFVAEWPDNTDIDEAVCETSISDEYERPVVTSHFTVHSSHFILHSSHFILHISHFTVF